MTKTRVAIIGTGNIGTDLMMKILRSSGPLAMGAFVGIDPESDGLARADRLKVPTVSSGVQGLIEMPGFADIRIIFDATSAQAHHANAEALRPYGKLLVDLTPAAIGPYVIPTVNLEQHLGAENINMVTCGGQATIPMVAAVSRVTAVPYAEIVASISSRSAGPGTRANIDEFTDTTRRAIEQIGGAAKGKAIIVLNPAEPPMIMRDTVLCVVSTPDSATQAAIVASVDAMVTAVQGYVPGYELKHEVQFTPLPADTPMRTLVADADTLGPLTQVTIFLAVEGAGAYLPSYAGNLDIMTAAALRVGERLAERSRAIREQAIA